MGLIFDGIDLKTNYNFVVTNINGRGSPPVSRTMLELPRIDGAIELNSKLQSRNITIRGYVYGTDASTKKDALVKLITQAYSREKKLTFPDTNRSIYVKLAGEPIVLGPVGPVLNAQAYELTFNFVAQDPYFYGEDHDESGFRIVKVNANAPTYLISPRRKFLKREASLKIEPYTIVNLLGKYGDFETEGGTPGLADGWENFSYQTPMLDTSLKIYGQQSQKFTGNGASTLLNCQTSWDISYQAGHKYFVSTFAKVDAGFSMFYFESFNVFTKILTGTADTFKKYYTTFESSVSELHSLYLVANYGDTTTQDGKSMWVDGFMLVDLTAMGSLPYGLQRYFGLQKWEDLATTSNIEALDGTIKSGEDWLAELLPYVNGIASLDFAWEGI